MSQYGAESYVGYKLEASYGSGGTPDYYIQHKSESFKPQMDLIDMGNELNASRYEPAPIAGRKWGEGEIVHSAYPDKIGILLLAFFSTPSSVDTVASGVYDNNFCAGLSVDKSLSIEVGKGGANPLGFTGFMLKTLKLGNETSGDKQKLEIAIGGGGKHPTEGSASVPVLSSLNPFRFFDAVLQLDDVTINVDSVSLELDNGLLIPNHKISAGQDCVQPVPNARFTGRGNFQIEWEDMTYFDKWRNRTAGKLVATYTSLHAISGSYYYTLTITMPVISFENPVPDVGGPDLIKAPIGFRMHSGTVGADTTPIGMTLRDGTDWSSI